jgi:hypothetical protein
MNSREVRIKSWRLADQIYDRLDWDDLALVWEPGYQGLAEMVNVDVRGGEIIITLRPEHCKVFIETFPEDTPVEEIIESVVLRVVFS